MIHLYSFSLTAINNIIATGFLIVIVTGIIIFLRARSRASKLLKQKLSENFSEQWKKILDARITFYSQLNESDKIQFEKRVLLFLATKKIEGIDTDIDDTIRLMVASSAIIPTFAFPDYNYPNVSTILIYPGSFDEKFQTQKYEGHQEFILGMVGNRFMTGTVILSKPDLVKAFDGLFHKSNVGIHEFVHLLDKDDGIVDGVPENLLKHQYVGPWLIEIKKELKEIEHGKSDINPYALTNNAEFLAVVSEYFFNNPQKFKKRHPELYHFLSLIFNTVPQNTKATNGQDRAVDPG